MKVLVDITFSYNCITKFVFCLFVPSPALQQCWRHYVFRFSVLPCVRACAPKVCEDDIS